MLKIITKQGGETIVEVLISIAVIAATLGAAFAISNRSEKTTQANQERYQAQLFANEQADKLRLVKSDDIPTSGSFCIEGGDSTNIYTNTADCLFGDNDLYEVLIERLTTTNTYKIFVTWDSITPSTNDGKDRIELVYGL
jgi:Tfp pilus assembly protein PilV